MIADDLRSNIKLNKILGAHAVIRCVSLTYMRVLLSYCISAKKDDKICVHQSTPARLSGVKQNSYCLQPVYIASCWPMLYFQGG
jgi:hypothetical protein